jgi:hypothetical protein
MGTGSGPLAGDMLWRSACTFATQDNGHKQVCRPGLSRVEWPRWALWHARWTGHYRSPSHHTRDRVRVSANAFMGELLMRCLKRWFFVMALGVTPLAGLTNCVVAPVAPAPPGYVVSPPVVVIRPYRPYRPYYGWYPYAHRW